MKKAFIVMAAALFLSTSVHAGQYVIRLAHWAASTHPVTQSVEFFKKGLEEESEGAFKVNHFPNNQLGSEDTFIDQVQRGTIQMAISGTLIKKDEPNVGLIDTPFVVQSWDHARRIYLEDPRGAEILSGKYTDKTKVKIKGYVINGFRQVTSKSPVATLEEFAKLKLRVPNNEIYVRFFQALGVNAVMMPMTEIYNALETNVVDGQENPYATIKSAGFWEVQKGVLETRHIFSTSPVLVNGRFYDRLPDDKKELLDKWIAKLVEHNWELSEKDENEAKQFMKDNGVAIVPMNDDLRKQFNDRLGDFYTWLTGQIPAAKDWIEYCNGKK